MWSTDGLCCCVVCILQVRGPPAKAAFDAAGAPTKALEGFCRKAGVSVDAVTREADAKGVEYCWVEVKDAGKPAAQVRHRAALDTSLVGLRITLDSMNKLSCGLASPPKQALSM